MGDPRHRHRQQLRPLARLQQAQAEQREMRRLRRDILRLRTLFHSALDTGADRRTIVATAIELREKIDRLERLQSPSLID